MLGSYLTVRPCIRFHCLDDALNIQITLLALANKSIVSLTKKEQRHFRKNPNVRHLVLAQLRKWTDLSLVQEMT